eukprot:185164-Pyramimonas_sp.AAC.1
MDLEAVTRSLRDLGIPIDEVRFGTNAKYVGIYLGPDGCAESWRAPCRKLLECVAHIRELRISLAQNIRAYDMLAQPVLSYISQFYLADKRAFDTEHTALQRLTAAPRHSISTTLLKNLSSLGFDAVPRHISCENRAALYRAALRSSVFPSIAARFHSIAEYELDVLVVPRMKEWLNGSVTMSCMVNFTQLTALAPHLADPEVDDVQKKMTKFLKARLPGVPAIPLLHRRIQYFWPEAPTGVADR